MIFGFLYEKGIIKNNSKLFWLWIWLVRKRWYQLLLIPMHIILGIYYKYTFEQIYYFCKGIIKNKRKIIYRKQFKPGEAWFDSDTYKLGGK